MPDIIDENGLQIKTAIEIREDLENGLRSIYGQDINLDQNSPDGQMVGIITQMAVDIRELASQINNGFNPDRASGRLLDERVVINNIERNGGNYTILDIDITTDRTVSLDGLDEDFNESSGVGYTVQDNAGNEFILIDSVELTAGTTSVSFRAKNIGRIETTIGTITIPVTIVLGVISINNSSAPTTIGQIEETDLQLRVRRQRSVALSSTGYLNGLLGDVLAIDGVTDAKLYENVTNSVDADGIPAHGIWLIAEGGASTDIGQEIYKNKSYGANMKGSVEDNIITASGGLFVAKFDRPSAEDLHIRFEIKRTVPLYVFDEAVIKQYIVDNLLYPIGDYSETSEITNVAIEAIASQGGGGVPINVEVSDDGSTWVDFLNVPTLDGKWTLDASRITIDII